MSCDNDKTYEPCSCGCGGGNSDCTCDCNECAPVNCIEQAIRDALATLQEQLEALVKRAEDAAKSSEDAAAASAASAAEAKGYRDAAELAATTATDALKTITDVAVSLEETAKKLQEIADELATAIAGIAVVTWYYTAISEDQTVIPVPDDKNALDVQCIYIEGVRQEPGHDRDFVFDKTTKTITLAEGIPLGLEISIILGTYSDNPADFPQTLASNIGASLIGTTSGQTVQQDLNAIDSDLIKLKLNWAIENGYTDSGLTFTVGGTLTTNDRNKVVYDPVSKTWYSWGGALPHVIAAGTNPVGLADWHPQTDPDLRNDLASSTGFSLIGAANYADVRANTNPVNGRVYSLGKVNKYDGGFGIFESDPTDATSADNGGTILVDTTGLRWKRQTVGAVNLGWFATGDGSTDDTAATQAAVDATPWGGTLIVPTPKSMYKISSAITINKPIKIVGDGGSTVARKQMPCFKAVGHNDIFKLVPVLDGYRFDYGLTGVTIQDLMLEGPELYNNGYCGISVDETVNAGVFHIRENNFSGLHIRYFDFGIKLAGVVYLNNFYNVRALWCSTGCNIDKVVGSTEGGSDQNRFFGCEFVLNGRGLSLSEFSFAGSQSIIGCTISENTTVGIVAGWNTSFYMSGSQIENNPIGVNFTIPASVGNPASEGSKTIVGNCFLFNGYDIWVQKSTTALTGGFPFPLLITGNGFAQTKHRVLYVQAPTGPREFDSRQFIFSSSNCYSGTDGKTGPVPFNMIESDWRGYNGFKEDGKVTLNTAVTGDVSKNVGFFNVPYGHQCYIKYNIVSVPTNAASGNTQVSASINITNVNNPSSPVVIKSDFGREGEVILSRQDVGSGLNVMIAMNANDAASTAIGVISYCII